jgi:CRP-like cAMP-binding protein
LQEERLHRLVLDHPDLGWGLMRLLARMAASSIQRALRLASASAPQRLVDALVMLAELPEARRAGAAAAVIEGISQETLAGMTGASRPWVAQAMGDLAQRGLLVPSRLRIVVPDVARLRAAVSTG